MVLPALFGALSLFGGFGGTPGIGNAAAMAASKATVDTEMKASNETMAFNRRMIPIVTAAANQGLATQALGYEMQTKLSSLGQLLSFHKYAAKSLMDVAGQA